MLRTIRGCRPSDCATAFHDTRYIPTAAEKNRALRKVKALRDLIGKRVICFENEEPIRRGRLELPDRAKAVLQMHKEGLTIHAMQLALRKRKLGRFDYMTVRLFLERRGLTRNVQVL